MSQRPLRFVTRARAHATAGRAGAHRPATETQSGAEDIRHKCVRPRHTPLHNLRYITLVTSRSQQIKSQTRPSVHRRGTRAHGRGPARTTDKPRGAAARQVHVGGRRGLPPSRTSILASLARSRVACGSAGQAIRAWCEDSHLHTAIAIAICRRPPACDAARFAGSQTRQDLLLLLLTPRAAMTTRLRRRRRRSQNGGHPPLTSLSPSRRQHSSRHRRL